MSEKADAAEAVELADYRAQKQADALRIQKESDDYLIESLRGDVARLTDALKNIEAAHLLLRAEVEAAARWFFDMGRTGEHPHGTVFDAAWSRYQQERKGEGHE